MMKKRFLFRKTLVPVALVPLAFIGTLPALTFSAVAQTSARPGGAPFFAPAFPAFGGAIPGAAMPSRGLNSSVFYSVNVLIVPLDDVQQLAAVSDARSPGAKSNSAFASLALKSFGGANGLRLAQLPAASATTPDDGDSLNGFNASDGFFGGNPGVAQQAAESLRQALLRQGLRDVLSAAPDSAVMRRALNDKRVSRALFQTLQKGMTQLIASPRSAAATTTAVAGDAVSVTVPPMAADATKADAAKPDVTPDEAERRAIEATQSATQAAVQLGRALNYQAVIVMAVLPQRVDPLASGTATRGGRATYALLSVDALRESGSFVAFEAEGESVIKRNRTAAQTAAQTLGRRLLDWRPLTASERSQRVDEYIKEGRAALERGDFTQASASARQAIAADPARSDADFLLGDSLKTTDPAGAAEAYKRGLQKGNGSQNGEVQARLAIAYAAAKDWPSTLQAGKRALALHFDSAALRAAMATAQFGRAKLFRNANRDDSAEEAAADGREHLNHARALAPDDPEIARMLAEQMVAQNQYREALQLLDVLAPKYPNDLALQTLYATALTERGGRNAEAFAAWARVWKASGVQSVPLETRSYTRLAQGFDEYVNDLARQALLEVNGVAAGTMPREAALLKLNRWDEAMETAKAAISLILPPLTTRDSQHDARINAADLLSQALDEERVYLETGDDLHRSRAASLHRQAILRLNAARTRGG